MEYVNYHNVIIALVSAFIVQFKEMWLLRDAGDERRLAVECCNVLCVCVGSFS